ncbi:MAG: hypothetical protein ABSB31_05475 [Dehalococcoidia bacterium]|jgi:hypothetical protein
MTLANRLKQLESKIRPVEAKEEHPFSFDEFIPRLGLEPAAVRELAQSKGRSLIEAMCEMLGIEVREFMRQLREKIGPVR